MLKRIGAAFVLSFMAMMIGGCSGAFAVNEEQMTQDMASQIVEAIDSGDPQALKNLLSQETIDVAGDLDEGIAYIFEIYEGPSKEYWSQGTYYGEQYNSSGWAKHANARYYVDTSRGRYRLSFEYWIVDTMDPNKEGVYRMSFMLAEEADRLSREYENAKAESRLRGDIEPIEWNYGALYERPGIYHPGWETEGA